MKSMFSLFTLFTPCCSGIYERGPSGYKHIYFNITSNTFKIWMVTVLSILLVYESVKRILRLHFTGQVREERDYSAIDDNGFWEPVVHYISLQNLCLGVQYYTLISFQLIALTFIVFSSAFVHNFYGYLKLGLYIWINVYFVFYLWEPV